MSDLLNSTDLPSSSDVYTLAKDATGSSPLTDGKPIAIAPPSQQTEDAARNDVAQRNSEAATKGTKADASIYPLGNSPGQQFAKDQQEANPITAIESFQAGYRQGPITGYVAKYLDDRNYDIQFPPAQPFDTNDPANRVLPPQEIVTMAEALGMGDTLKRSATL